MLRLKGEKRILFWNCTFMQRSLGRNTVLSEKRCLPKEISAAIDNPPVQNKRRKPQRTDGVGVISANQETSISLTAWNQHLLWWFCCHQYIGWALVTNASFGLLLFVVNCGGRSCRPRSSTSVLKEERIERKDREKAEFQYTCIQIDVKSTLQFWCGPAWLHSRCKTVTQQSNETKKRLFRALFHDLPNLSTWLWTELM